MVYRVSTKISKEKFESMISGGKTYVPTKVTRAIEDGKKGELLSQKSVTRDEAIDAIKYLVGKNLIKTSKTPFKLVQSAAREQWKDEQKAKAKQEGAKLEKSKKEKGDLPDGVSKRFSASTSKLAQKIRAESRLVHQRLKRAEDTPDDDTRISATRQSVQKLEEHAKKAEREAKVLKQELKKRGIKGSEQEGNIKELMASAKEARKQAKTHEKLLGKALEGLEIKRGHIGASIRGDLAREQAEEEMLADRSGGRLSKYGTNVLDNIKKEQKNRNDRVKEETDKRQQQSGDNIKKKQGPDLADVTNLPDMDIG